MSLRSSPRRQGTCSMWSSSNFSVRIIPNALQAARRIIPADAGSTLAYRLRFGRREDHPRGCGEHPGSTGMRSEASGSSPRMRGAQAFGPDDRARRGIIPADAGSTVFFMYCSLYHGDHPRGCGEHGQSEVDTGRRAGSSPRMRGALCLSSCL